jgi:hypothetical protein
MRLPLDTYTTDEMRVECSALDTTLKQKQEQSAPIVGDRRVAQTEVLLRESEVNGDQPEFAHVVVMRSCAGGDGGEDKLSNTPVPLVDPRIAQCTIHGSHFPHLRYLIISGARG